MKHTALLFATILIFIFTACNIAEIPLKINPKTDTYSESITSDGIELNLEFILYDSISVSQVSIIKSKLQQNAGRIIKGFKIKSIDTFKVHVWGNYDNFLIAQEVKIGHRYNGSGGYVINANELAMYFTDNIEEVAEHEFVHAISLHVNSNFGNNPRWLWEAVALYEANEFNEPKDIFYLNNNNFPTLAELNGDFDLGNHRIYDVGYLIVEYIIEKWGSTKYHELIQESGDLQKVLDISVTDFESEWASFVKTKYLDK